MLHLKLLIGVFEDSLRVLPHQNSLVIIDWGLKCRLIVGRFEIGGGLGRYGELAQGRCQHFGRFSL